MDEIQAGALPATRHLADPELVALANRLYGGLAFEPEIEKIVNRLEARLATHSPSSMARPNRPVEVSR